ncbi:MAG: hypothetical protein WCT14_01510 [Treponemataceae bacterium]
MTVSQKISVSLLISVVLFAGFAALAFTGLFELVETRFYNPAVAKGLSRDVAADAASAGEFLDELRDRFSGVLNEGAVKRSFLPNQGAEDIFERTKLFGNLMESLPGLQSIRFIDTSGKRIHFSTSKSDILRQDRLSVFYRNYGETPGDLPFDTLAAADTDSLRLVIDAPRDRLLFSFPFRDSFDVYKGSALFSLSIRAVVERLIADGRIKVGEDLVLVPEPSGAVSGLPKVGRDGLVSAVAQAWRDGARGLTPLARSSEGKSFALVSGKTRGGFYVARVVGEDLFVFPPAMKAILLVSFFLTVYLIVFLFLNLRQDSMVVVRERIKRFQISLLEEYYDRKEALDWDRWSRELDQRREEVRGELKRGLGRAVRKRNEADVDALIDKSWDDLITALGTRAGAHQTVQPIAQIDERKLQDILGRILAAAPSVPAAAHALPVAGVAPSVHAAAQPSVSEEIEEAESVEDVEELEELGDGEELSAIAPLAPSSAEPVGAPTAASVEAAPEELEELEEFESVDEPEEIAELEAEVSVAPSVTSAPVEVSTLEEIEGATETEVFAELEPFAELEELEDAEDSGGVSTALSAAAEEIVPFETPEQVAEASEELSSAEDEEPAELEELTTTNPEKAYVNSNIRVVFDEDDDIPYIIETSGIELVDDDLNSVIDFLDRGRPEPVEELEVAELEELEGEGDDEEESGIPAEPPMMSEQGLDELARQIEFAPIIPSADEDHSMPDMDISSPFDTLFGAIDSERIEELEVESSHPESSSDEDAEVPVAVEPTASTYQPYFAGPAAFSSLLSLASAEEELVTLESVEGEIPEEPLELIDVNEDESQDASHAEYIVVKNGLAYVSDSAYEAKAVEASNPVLKDLAESVIGQQR